MHVAIIGNGITGVTAARAIRKRDSAARITLISAESDHHWSRPALMYVYMGHMRPQDVKPYPDPFWAKNRIDLVRGWVQGIDTGARTLTLDGQRTLQWDKLLIATGSAPNRFGWPGENLDRVSGMYGLQDLDALEQWTRDIRRGVIVGGGLIGIELAEMLHSRGRHVSLLVREGSYWNSVLPAEESAMVNDVIREAGIDLRLNEEMDHIEDDGRGAACAVVTKRGERIPCEYVGLTAGVRPNIAVCAGSGITTNRGVCVDAQLRTSAANVYAAGDCAEVALPGRERPLIQAVWYTGRLQGEVAAANLCGDAVDYDPGVWFNSAKFIDLEYQVYGDVPGATARTDVSHVLWRDDHERRSVRLCHRDGRLVGVNVMGVRYRHAVCEAWLRDGRDLGFVLDHLRDAAFDPEFSKRHDDAIRAVARRTA